MFKSARKLTQLLSATRYVRNFSSQQSTQYQDEIQKLKDDYCNIPPKILELVDRKLYLQPSHPIGIVTNRLKGFFSNPDTYKSPLQEKYKTSYYIAENPNPITTTTKNFDDLLVPPNHVSRKRSDTYYLTKDLLLRTHTSNHQKENIQAGRNSFIAISDVYRRDEIDATHYPCFHQVSIKRILAYFFTILSLLISAFSQRIF
jgi:phenylalanyl-tRNA synthetase alpha chain